MRLCCIPGIPVRIGIASTKILAKVAAEIAKREPVPGDVVSLAGLPEQELDAILETMGIENLWTIGKRRAQVLEAQEIFTAEILKYTPPGRARHLLGVVGERIVYELRGLSCIRDMATIAAKLGHSTEFEHIYILTIAPNMQKWYTFTGTQRRNFVAL